MLGGDPVVFLVGCVFLIPAILIAIPGHELGHGLAAVLLGDPSPRNRGYLTPRPQLFINVYGVLMAFLANVAFGNRIPINEYRLQSTGKKVAYALAGPAANLLLAILFGLVLRSLLDRGGVVRLLPGMLTPLGSLTTACYAIYFLNLSTFAFQLLPFPGLDGWRVVEAIFRRRSPRFFFDVDSRIQTIWVIAFAVVVFGPVLVHFDILGSLVGIFFQPASTAILGRCAGYTVLFPCPLLGRS